jgi:hypothetical protein
MTGDQFQEIMHHLKMLEAGGAVGVVAICAMLLWLGFCVLSRDR